MERVISRPLPLDNRDVVKSSKAFVGQLYGGKECDKKDERPNFEESCHYDDNFSSSP